MANRRLVMNENTTGSIAREDLLARVTEGMEVSDGTGDSTVFRTSDSVSRTERLRPMTSRAIRR